MDNLMQNVPKRCVICGTTQQLLRCAKCKLIYYCSAAHQHLDWPMHKPSCRHLAKLNENNKINRLEQAIAAATLSAKTSDAAHSATTEADAIHNTTTSSSAALASPTALLPPFSVLLSTVENTLKCSPTSAESLSKENNDISYIGYQNNQSADSTSMDLLQNRASSIANETPTQLQHPFTEESGLIPSQLQPQYTANFNSSSNNHNSQNEKSSSYEIGQGDENFSGNANERRYEDLCRNIINDMNQYGLSVVDDFLGMEKGLQILNEVHRMYAAGVFKDGQLVNNMKAEQDLRTIRGDKITWVKGVEQGCSNVGYLINQIDAVICRANTMKNNGKLGNYNIKERTKAMVACYPGSGSHYVMHVDNPNKDGRVITAIYYLNVNWDTKRSGGVLRIFPEHGNSVADIEPKFDRLIFFWSDKRNPHEVQPAHRTRYAITVWYFDANEREAALNRCKYENNVTTMTKSTTATPTPATNINTNTSLTNANSTAISNTTTNSSEICT